MPPIIYTVVHFEVRMRKRKHHDSLIQQSVLKAIEQGGLNKLIQNRYKISFGRFGGGIFGRLQQKYQKHGFEPGQIFEDRSQKTPPLSVVIPEKA